MAHGDLDGDVDGGLDGDLDKAQILANIPLPLLVAGSDHQIIYTNDAAEDFFGRSRKKMLGLPIRGILTFADAAMARLLDFDSGDISAQGTDIKTSGGIVHADISVVVMAQRPEWRLVIISPRHGARGQVSEPGQPGAQQAVGAPAILSHEIKNPLAGIKGAAQLLARQNGADSRALTDLIVTEVDRIARLLDQMQSLSNAGPRYLAAANVHAVIERAIRSVRAANRILPDVAINYDPSLPHVLIDEDAMVQILINLVQNAVDALDGRDGSYIGISTRFVMSGEYRDAGDEGRLIKLPVEISISDNGPGVAPHIAGELFSPFVTTKREGQGLGLAIVRKLVNQMNSRIVYERDRAAGITYFRLFLPVAPGGASK